MAGRAEMALEKPGPPGEHAHRRPAGDSSVAVGHVQRRSLVAGVNELDSLILGRIDQWKNGVAHDCEYFFRCLPASDSV